MIRLWKLFKYFFLCLSLLAVLRLIKAYHIVICRLAGENRLKRDDEKKAIYRFVENNIFQLCSFKPNQLGTEIGVAFRLEADDL